MSQRSLWDWRAEDDERLSVEESKRRTRGVLELDGLDDPEPARLADAHQLHWQLECHLGPVDMVVTDNRRRMITAKAERGRYRIRLHHMFLGCDPETVAAIVALARGEEEARRRLKNYVRCHRDAISFEPDDEELDAVGDHHDLRDILADARDHLEAEDAASVEDIDVTWGRDVRGSKSIRFGSFDFDQRLIRVHPALDQTWVPRYFVEFIVYHELLHAVCPPRNGDGRRRVHTEAFEERERRFPKYDDAMAWESENLSRLLNRDA